MQIYHGSNMVIENPRIIKEKFTKDFAYGFYCTNIFKQAKRWAKRKTPKIINEYEFNTEHLLGGKLNVLIFSAPNEDWLDFIVKCRSGESHTYDIVEGPMADDKIFNYINAFVNQEITREQFWSLAEFTYPTHQICFCTEKALEYLEYRGHENVKL